MKFTYTQDLPQTPEEIRAGFYRVPKSILLPPYLASNPYFVKYADAIDQVFDSTVEAPLYTLQNIRNMWTTAKGTEVKISHGQMLSFADWSGPDHATVVQQVNMLGMSLSTAESIDEVGYRTLAKFLGSYWYDKGKNSTIDFLNFCLGTNLVLIPLWTKDYVNFAPYPGDGNEFVYTPGRQTSNSFIPSPKHSVVGGWKDGVFISGVGQPLTQLGSVTPQTDDPRPWFPTTHVDISVPSSIPVSTLVVGRLFYEICNYNLVINRIDTPITGSTQADVVAAQGAINNSAALVSDYYPLLVHSKVGGWLNKVGSPLTVPTVLPF